MKINYIFIQKCQYTVKIGKVKAKKKQKATRKLKNLMDKTRLNKNQKLRREM